MDAKRVDEIVEAVVRELMAASARTAPAAAPLPVTPSALAPIASIPIPAPAPVRPSGELPALSIDLDDPTTPEMRAQPHLDAPDDREGLLALMATTPARIGLGRAGPRYRTAPWLLFRRRPGRDAGYALPRRGRSTAGRAGAVQGADLRHRRQAGIPAAP